MLLLVVISCNTLRPIEEFNVEELIASTTYQKSEFDQVGTLQGIEIRQSELTLFKDRSSAIKLRSFIHEKRITHQLYFYLTYVRPDWVFYDGVNLAGGRFLRTRSLDQSVLSCGRALGCSYSETLTLEIDDKLFQEASSKGLRFRLNSRYADVFWEYSIPANVFIAQEIASKRV